MKKIKGYTKNEVLEMAQELSRNIMEECIVDCICLPEELEDFILSSETGDDCEDFADWVFDHDSEECVTSLVDALIECAADGYDDKVDRKFNYDLEKRLDYYNSTPKEVIEAEVDKRIPKGFKFSAKDHSDLITYLTLR